MITKLIKRTGPLLLTLVLFSGVKAYAASNPAYFYDGAWHEYTEKPVYLKVNGDTVVSDMPPVLFNNSTLVPARAIFEKMGAKVTWDEVNSKVTVNLDKDTIELFIDNSTANVNGQSKTMPIPAKIINDRTMIPARFVSETLGNRVQWDDTNRLVNIDSPVNIKSISTSLQNNKLRITVEADRALFESNAFTLDATLDTPDKIVLDLQHSIIWPSTQNITVPQNATIKGIRVAQNSVKPYVTRVVADLNSKTKYTTSVSQDKKSFYMDIDVQSTSTDTPQVNIGEIGAPQVNYGISSMEIKLPTTASQYYLYSIGEKGIFYLDIPKSKFTTLPKIIQPADANIIKSVEFIQETDSCKLKIYSDKAVLTKVITDNGSIGLRLLTPESSNIEYTNNGGVPRIAFKSEVSSFNYFRYAFRNDGDTYVLRSYSNLGNLQNSKLFTNDGIIKSVSILPYGSYGLEYYFTPVNKLAFRINSVSKPNTIFVEPFTPRTQLGGDVPITDTMKQKLVVIDPGHGGSDPGAVVNGVSEKNLNLDISTKLFNMLKSAGFKAQMTRTDDRAVDLYDRAAMANDLNASLFISVHNNYLPGGGSGTMNFFYPSMSQAKYGISSERVAQIAQEETNSNLSSVNLGVWKRPRLAVLNGTNMPAVLAEIGVMNDPAELANLQSDGYKTKAATALFNVVKRSLYEMEFKEAAVAMLPDPAVSRSIADSTKPVTANGFSVPALATAKCAYNWRDPSNSYYFDLSIFLDYSKEVSKTATLDEQRKEAIAVLSSKLDANTVSTISEILSRQVDYTSYFYEEELETAEYTIWVRDIKMTGICSIDIKRK